MSSPHNPPRNYWGFMIRADKSATPLFEQLCLGIAKFITDKCQSNTEDLTPENLAYFYREVGGNYDNVFLHTPHSSLSFIYQSLGCFHTLQPTEDPFKSPCIPALRPHGFIRWQTIQLLLCPDEHVRFLQKAVKKFDIINPSGGCIFPKVIPRDSFPAEPDPEMVKWHETVSQKLEDDYRARKQKSSSHRPGLSDRVSSDSRAGSKSLDGSVPDENPGYFASRKQITSKRPGDYSRTTSQEPSSPYNARPHKRVVPEFTSPLSTEPELRHDDIEEEEDLIPIYGPKIPHSKPTSRHRHSRHEILPSVPPRRRLSRAPSKSSLLSEESEEPVRRSRARKAPGQGVDYEKIFPSRSSHARRHSHDAAYTTRKGWNYSPPPRRLQREEPLSPEPTQTHDFYPYVHKAADFRTYHDDARRMSLQQTNVTSTRKLKFPLPTAPHPGIKFREYIFNDDTYAANSAPTSPVHHHGPHLYRTTTTTNSSRGPTHSISNNYRQYASRIDPESLVPVGSHSSRRKASASANDESPSDNSMERARAMSMGAKQLSHLRIDQTMGPMMPMMPMMYVTPPPPPVNGVGAPVDFEQMGDGRGRHGRRGY
ncbi:hypothetical protein PAAG_06821 [Paracoccidioides lutzii Pb01]|uniref:DUF7514 domain-containing protein n=1 Tax=Paracoccidioides lutzii (strain ATCC MYA-826 / Pb01) TaxID=502779 RepID=C1H7T0_PARBA|nr:hypothetical protein PAAG_06821 [Paracoccidioides lutzii Pb01]EEH36403.2 hypothetical protein PAAG_06821 [Paracoccidioides lutzii Pb01]